MQLIERQSMGLNHLWSRLVMEELYRCGVRNVCMAPGGQSTPLVIAAAEHEGIATTVHHDERGAAFYALGLAKAALAPTALICTSGTAAANFYPAVVEAYKSHTPLVVMTADLPGELTDSGVNQAIDQSRVFSDYVRWRFDFHVTEGFSMPALLTAIDHAVARACGTPRGPVHLNCRFAKPLIVPNEHRPGELAAELRGWAHATQPFTRYVHCPGHCPEAELRELAARIDSAERGLIVVGEQPAGASTDAIIELARALEWPLLAEITSQARTSAAPEAPVFAHFVLYLGGGSMPEPDLVLHFGGDLVLHVQGDPVRNCLNDYLQRSNAEQVLINEHPSRQDPHFLVRRRIQADSAATAAALLPLIRPRRSQLLSSFVAAERAAEAELRAQLDSPLNRGELSELAAVAVVAEEIEPESGLFLANSLPIRQADMLFPVSEKRLCVVSHHGVKGIDGTIAAACGFAGELAAPTTLIIGDVSFLHDLSSLRLAASGAPLTIVLLNNDGGNIFSYIPSSKTEQFQEFFLAPHGLTFEHAANLFGIEYRCPRTPEDFRSAYRTALAGRRGALIEVCCARSQFIFEQEQLFSAVHSSVNAALRRA